MHSGTSVAQPCFTCGAGRETRTPTPKRWYLKPMRLPIPPYPHVGRRYVTMFWKGQARLIAASRFARTFIGSPPQPQKPAGTFLPFRARTKENGAPADDDTRGRKTAHAVSLFPSGFTCSDRKNAQHLCGYMTLYIGHAARHFTRMCASSRIPYTDDLCIPILASALPDPSYSAGPHGLAATDAAKFTKSTQIGHKLCSSRRNWGHLSACFAFHA